MTVTERQRLRNQISAQKSRLKKKEESIFLNKVVRLKDERYQEMVKILSTIIDEKQSAELMSQLTKVW